MSLKLNLDPFADSVSVVSSEQSGGVIIKDGEPVATSPRNSDLGLPQPVRMMKGVVADGNPHPFIDESKPKTWPATDASSLERSVKMRDEVYKQYKEVYSKLSGTANYFDHLAIKKPPLVNLELIPPMEPAQPPPERKLTRTVIPEPPPPASPCVTVSLESESAPPSPYSVPSAKTSPKASPKLLPSYLLPSRQ